MVRSLNNQDDYGVHDPISLNITLLEHDFSRKDGASESVKGVAGMLWVPPHDVPLVLTPSNESSVCSVFALCFASNSAYHELAL